MTKWSGFALIFAWLSVGSCTGRCPTFKEIREETFECEEACLSTGNGAVFGTLQYHEDSAVCLAALHAAAINATGGLVRFTKSRSEKKDFFGTARNRVASKNWKNKASEYYSFPETNAITREDLKADVILAHDSYLTKSSINTVCISQDKSHKLSEQSIVRWSYNPYNNCPGSVTSAKVKCSYAITRNFHALGCLGRGPATDLLATFSFLKASDYWTNTPTIRGTRGKDLTIDLNKRREKSGEAVNITSLPKSKIQTDWNIPVVIKSLQPYHAGVYYIGDDKTGSYFDVVVKKCEDGKFGPKCEANCPECQHGGQCHSEAGVCVCPPGYYGDECQHACLPGRFGAECQLSCDTATLLFSVPSDGECKGVTLCVPRPYGCSCAPGYTGLACDQECSNGTFGVNCQSKCEGCSVGACDQVTGTCTECEPDSSCISPPLPPRGLTASVPAKGLDIAWQGTEESGVVYFLTYQEKDCSVNSARGEEGHLVASVPSVRLEDLSPLSRYKVCVVASGRGGHSLPACLEAFTAPQTDNETFSCTVSLATETSCSLSKINLACAQEALLRVNITLTTYIACNDERPVSKGVWKESIGVIPGQRYSAKAEVLIGGELTGATAVTEFQTPAAKPPPVRNLTAAIICPTQVRLFWDDPCPPNGDITHFYIENGGRHQPVKECDTPSSYERCHLIPRLSKNRNYKFGVQVQTGNSYWGDLTFVEVEMKERTPGPASVEAKNRQTGGFTLAIRTPTDPGGELVNCTAALPEKGFTCFRSIAPSEGGCPSNVGGELPECEELTGLAGGKTYSIATFCCNAMFCSEEAAIAVATLPLIPDLSGSPVVQRSSNTTISIALPELTSKGEGQSSMAIVIQTVDSESEGGGQAMEDSAKDQLSKGLQTDPKEYCNQDVRIAGVVQQGTTSFQIGDGGEYGGYPNCPLGPSKLNKIGVLAVNELQGEKTYAWHEYPGVFKTEEWEPGSNFLGILIGLLLLLLLLIIVLAVVIYRYPDAMQNWKRALLSRDQQNKTLVPKESETSDFPNGVTPTAQPINAEDIHDPLYENIQLEEIYSNETPCVTRLTAEDYLNRIINSQEASEEFRTVAENAGKTMDVGQLPENVKKNRYKNNLPYDDTRVVLSSKDGIPGSDYINANHIQGYKPGMRYIATQGPKTRKENTVADFWRMVWEQQVSVVVMVANFIEGGKEKVAEYFNIGSYLETEDKISVSIVHRESLPHFTICRIRLCFETGERIVWHYQYTSWPDHGVPIESLSLASMVRHLAANHTEGVAVVHCSAGIGRTGTILLVMLLNEMLHMKGSIDPIDTLTYLRGCRARLVESYAQYTLGLQVFDEVLFGTDTLIGMDHLYAEMPRLLQESAAQFKRLKALPSPLAYKVMTEQEAVALTRNHAAFPSDLYRITLSFQEGIQESQYINAIRIPGLSNMQALLVTEHPLASTVDRFWRLITEKRCPMVVFINEFFTWDKNEFPKLLPNQGEAWIFNGFQVQTQSAQPYSSSLSQARISVTNSQGETYNIVVYQVEGWEYGQELPPSLNILVTLADLILQSPRGSYSGPPLLCCGDGVTACGLVAGVSLILERATNFQNVDVYRTAVMLLRCRQQFLTSQAQFAALFEAVALYLENFSTYSNIS